MKNLARPSGEATAFAAMTKTRKHAVQTLIESDILELRLAPGARLVEADLAARFGVSKTPIREALHSLEQHLLVELEPYAGARVTMLSTAEYRDLVSLLDQVEQPALAGIVTNRTDGDIVALDGLMQTMDTAFSSGDGSVYREALQSMHSRLFSIAGNPHLDRIIAELAKLSRRYEAAFTHRFEDTWQMEIDLVRLRLEAVRGQRLPAVSASLAKGHARLMEILTERANSPELRGNFAEWP